MLDVNNEKCAEILNGRYLWISYLLYLRVDVDVSSISYRPIYCVLSYKVRVLISISTFCNFKIIFARGVAYSLTAPLTHINTGVTFVTRRWLSKSARFIYIFNIVFLSTCRWWSSVSLSISSVKKNSWICYQIYYGLVDIRYRFENWCIGSVANVGNVLSQMVLSVSDEFIRT